MAMAWRRCSPSRSVSISMLPLSPSRCTSARFASRHVAVDRPSTATISAPLRIPASCAALPSAIAAVGVATWVPRTATSQKNTNANTKFAAGPAAAMAIRHWGLRRS